MKKYFVLVIVLLSCRSYAQNVWRSTNGPSAGTVNASLFFADSSILIGTERGGIYRTTDGGNTWASTNTGLPTKDIRSFAVDSEGNFYAGTNGNGICISTDSGVTWHQMSNGLNNVTITSIAIDSAGHIYALTTAGLYALSADRTSWHNLGLGNITCIAVRRNGQLYAGTREGWVFRYDNPGWTAYSLSNSTTKDTVLTLLIDKNEILYAGTTNGVYKLPPGSFAWQSLNSGILSNATIIALVVRDSEMYAASFDNNIERSDILHSTNAGASWKSIGGDDSIISIFIIPNDEVYIVTNASVEFVTDQYAYWMNTNPEYVGGFINCILAADSKGKIIAATDNGVFSTTDGGNSWITTDSGIVAIERDTFAKHTSPVQIKNIIIGASCMSVDKKNRIYINDFASLFRSSDDGISWEEIDRGEIRGISNLTSIAIDHKGYIFTSVSSLGEAIIYRSTDDGRSWSFMGGAGYHSINTLLIDDNDNLYAGNSDLYRSTDDGKTWIYIDSDSIKHSWIYSLSLDSKGFIYASTGNGVYRTTDSGTTWENMSTTMHLHSFSNTFAIDKYGTTYAAVGDSGVQYLPYNGTTWQYMSAGFPSSPGITSVAIDSDGYLYAGSSSGIVYKTELPLTGVSEQRRNDPSSFSQLQNYPNPAASATTIMFNTASEGNVTLKIYNALGNEVTTLVSDRLAAGAHSAQWDTNNLPQGVYYYQLQAGGKTQTKKIVLVK